MSGELSHRRYVPGPPIGDVRPGDTEIVQRICDAMNSPAAPPPGTNVLVTDTGETLAYVGASWQRVESMTVWVVTASEPHAVLSVWTTEAAAMAAAAEPHRQAVDVCEIVVDQLQGWEVR